MKIILTHEQADFDAIASLLGASLLYDDVIPVLPHKVNRNVKAFLYLYGEDFPFIEQRDLPNQEITEIFLVDTHSLISLKGMNEKTKIHIIDHHPVKKDLPENWDITTVNTGANTTVLVEALRECNGNLSVIETTLLLLGIYEDTGSLTYSRTTPRDLIAAAYLLERGASLNIANNYLNLPLTEQQQKLYEKLRASANHFKIFGYSIMIACADEGDVEEELSSIAHKIRDNFEPDALFVFVKIRSGVQLIARSTTDHIDVGKVAEYFGGGGHVRAAASLIHKRSLKELCEELENILPKFIKPPISVEQIMSRDPSLLSPETSAKEAAIKMQRFGYEGYPVVKNGEVIGLLTRRAVDRAITHRLNLSAERLMESGNYFVTPEDSIDYVQKIMTETGWGQLPVVNPETQEIIGIVTRTDLLKTLAPEVKLPEERNLATKLEAALPKDRVNLLKAIADVAQEQRAAFYIVGGFVRDLLLGSPSLDFDLVVEGNAIELAFELSKRYGGRVTSHSRFGTAKWHLDEGALKEHGLQLENAEEYPKLDTIDLVSARTEFYTHPTALPHVERGSIKLDLHRRDFTINTLALRLDGNHYGELHDYWGGVNDLQEGLVRVLHSLSFVDDPTRILRAVRFEQRFEFVIEQRTLQLLKEAIPLLDRLSGDRLRHELNHIFVEKNATKIFKRLDELGLIQAISPHLYWDSWLNKKIGLLYEIKPDEKWSVNLDNKKLNCYLGYIFFTMRLGEKERRDVGKRLKLSTDLTRNILYVSKLYRLQETVLKGSNVSGLVDVLDETPALARYAFYLATDDITIKKKIERYIDYWQFVRPSITGEDLKKIGLEPGPQYKKILKSIRDAWLDGLIKNKIDERKFLDSRILKWNSGQRGENSKLDNISD